MKVDSEPTQRGSRARNTPSCELALPTWVTEQFRVRPLPTEVGAGLTAEWSDAGVFSLVSVCVPQAAQLQTIHLQQKTTEAYEAAAEILARTEASHPVRVWNFIPGIHAPSGKGPRGEAMDRYMVFNAGRFQACKKWFGSPAAFDEAVPTATGVGHHGDDLVIHVLGAHRAGRAVANPRQVAPYHYSQRFGPVPPCFARATVLREQLVLVGGTASIRGEDSLHIGDLAGQVAETLENIRCLVAAAEMPATLTDVRAYYVREKDRPQIESFLADAFRAGARLEFVRADLCRAELLLEIEGIARAEGDAK